MLKRLKQTEHVTLFNLIDPSAEVCNQLINAFIIGMINFFTTMLGVATVTLFSKPTEIIVSALISFGLSFFVSLAAQRGLKVTPQSSSQTARNEADNEGDTEANPT